MDLRPCNSVSDRCVVQMTKNGNNYFVLNSKQTDNQTNKQTFTIPISILFSAENGEFKLKRECGLGPCTFEDDMANKGLGWVNKCDRSKNSYFCLWCCKGNGCNKNAVSTAFASKSLIVTMLVIILLALIKGFQPPYAPENHVIK